MSTDHPTPEKRARRLGTPSPGVGVFALVLTQAGDLVTTLVALRSVPALEEANVVVARAIAAFGPTVGLTVASVVAVGSLVAATELGAAIVRDHADGSRRVVGAVRLLGYGPATALNAGVVAHNVLLLATV
ncbi:hypothetical protein [Halorarum halobium]|uniref:hypothetical protein n=1 Tax=Halorarum halobium TaxID=3075121 RepID=UPI0028B08DB7|nr:hypothetical protein [Halobaculum sp. XH14]